jgi:hypothetical protein|tara:strand:- start:442 stop:606 length:165 start_codon:yes stop_codon:yes gene_type:complete
MRWKLVCSFKNKKTMVKIFNTKPQAQKEIDSRRGLMYAVNVLPEIYSIERTRRK